MSEQKNIEKNDLKQAFSTNKPAYLVKVLCHNNIAQFVTQKIEYASAVFKFVGYEINPNETINNLEDAEKYAKREQIYDIAFPWHRVESIRNITYQIKG